MKQGPAPWRFIASWLIVNSTLRNRIQEFIENEGKSSSFDPKLITPEYVYRMWGRAVAIEVIVTAMADVRRMM